MSISIRTNTSSIIAQSSLTNSTNKLNQTIERMSTGAKLNHASDNAANYSISTNLTTRINAYQVAEDNVNMGLDMVQTASSALENMGDMTARLRALATQARNGTYGNKSLDALNKEAQAIISELYRVKETASYNNIKLFNDFNSTAPTSANGSKLVPNEKGFLKDVVERDTSTMDRLEDVDPTTTITSGTYSISTEEGLVKLTQMVKAKKISGKCEFVLGADIDISKFCKSNLNAKGEGGWIPIGSSTGCKLDGNGHTISGLYINRPTTNFQGFIGHQEGMAVKNLGLINPVVIGAVNTGALRESTYGKNLDNCFVEGGYVKGTDTVGGLVGLLNYSSASYCYTTCDVEGTSNVGGISGIAGGAATNCYSSGNVTGTNKVGGIIGTSSYNQMKNCAVYGVVDGTTNTGIFLGNSSASTFKIIDSSYNQNVNSMLSLVGGDKKYTITNVTGVNFGAKVGLQVGVNSTENSEIKFEAWFALDGLSQLMKTRMESDSSLGLIDGIMKQIEKKQTEYGAVENRLMSALDEISTQYENLVSTRSTLKDADMGELSSEYIKMQILQNASATLLSTANQSPALALQLL